MPMMKHALKVIKEAVTKLNDSQIPVVACDQPLFALMKQIQWQFPNFDEQHFVIFFGGLHIEMGFFSLIGKLLDQSGWTDVLSEAEVTTSGRAHGLLSTQHLKRTRYAHEVSLLTFSKLKRKAFDDSNTDATFDEWSTEQCATSPTFFFWDLIMRMQTLIFLFIRSQRQRNFNLYRCCLERMMPFFLALDSFNYSRWLSVHVRDLKNLPDSIHEEFQKGNFVVAKSIHKFSSIAIDQAHEMTNKVIKGTGGAIGLFHTQQTLTQWLLLIPELTRLLQEFRICMPSVVGFDNETAPDNDVDGDDDNDDDDDIPLLHHEQTKGFQKQFYGKARKLYSKVLEYGNPFESQDGDLIRLTTRGICDPSVVHDLKNLEKLGKEQYDAFNNDVLVKGTKSIHDAITKNSFKLFSTKLRDT